jgi:hypothetical protein
VPVSAARTSTASPTPPSQTRTLESRAVSATSSHTEPRAATLARCRARGRARTAWLRRGALRKRPRARLRRDDPRQLRPRPQLRRCRRWPCGRARPLITRSSALRLRRRSLKEAEKAGKGRGFVSIDTGSIGVSGQAAVFAGVSEAKRDRDSMWDTTTVSCASNCNSPSIPPATRESSRHAGLRRLKMARPGLEPGTPRFSVVCSTN